VDSRGSTNDRIIDGDEKHTHLWPSEIRTCDLSGHSTHNVTANEISKTNLF
jgi:hypothetical protein